MSKISKANKIVASIVLAVILLVGCGLIYSNLSKSSNKIEVSENQKDIDIKTGQEFVITLTSNPSTGYSWSVDDTYNKNIVTKISNEFQPADTKKSGAPGKELWTFKGTGQGSTNLSLKYTRQNGNQTTQINSKVFNVTVK